MIKVLFIALCLATLYAEPAWVTHPPYGVVGVANKNSDATLQKRIALINAKAELAKQKKMHIQSENILIDSSFSSKDTQKSFELIEDASILQEHKADDGTLYLWVQ